MIALAPLTTLRLGGPARRLVEPATSDELVAAIRAADAASEPVLLLGGGSNVVISDDGFPGTVIRIGHLGRTPLDGPLLRVEAGEDWDVTVAASVAAGLGGLECLSGIPGRTGATPVQNVGAYGVEIADVLESVDLYDRRADAVRTAVPASELGLAYRTSTLKGRADVVVLAVTFRLTADGLSAPIRYAELARTLGVEPGARVQAVDARAAVLQLRRGKGMVLDTGDRDTWSVGSFFTNPVLERAPEGAPTWPAADGRVKVPAAWLIQHSGFARGHAGPGARVALSTKHVLALTHRGDGTTADLLALAREVRDGVRSHFGVNLSPEPVLIGCAM